MNTGSVGTTIGSAVEQSTTDQLRILYVDGDEDRLERTRTRLEAHYEGFTVHAIGTMAAALDRLDELTYDCVVSDYDLGETDGISFLRAVRHRDPDLPFILVTDSGTERIASRAISAGVTDYLRRDAETDLYVILSNRIRNAVDQRRAERMARRVTKAVDIVDEPMAFFDADGRLDYANEAYGRLFGEPPSAVVGTSLEARFAADERDRFETEIRPTAHEMGRWTGTAQARRTDGDEFPAEHSLFRLVDGGYLHRATDISRQESREARLASFRKALEHAGHAVTLTDTDGTIEYVNPAFEAQTGYTSAEAVGETPSLLKSGTHDDAFYEDLWETIVDGQVWEGELVNERKDGTRYTISQTIAPIEDVDGEHVGFVAVNTDISDRKERERDLAFFEQAIEQVGTGMAAYDEDGTIRYANERYAELLGTSREALVGTHICTVNPRFSRDRFRTYWDSFEDGETRVRETIHERFDDEEQFPVTTSTTRVRIHDTDYNIGTISDISEQKARERDLRTFRQAIEHAGHTVVLTDTDGTIEYANPAFEDQTGYDREAVVGETPALLKSGKHDDAFYADLWETIQSGEVWEGEVINQDANGDHYHIDQTIAPITTDDGEIERFVAINTDISSLKEHEQELERQNERLERYGRTVAHDLRNPLNVLESRLEYLEQTDDGHLGDHCGDLYQSIDTMKTLIDELLTLAEHGQTVLEPSAVSLSGTATAAWEQTETGAATVDVGESLELRADETRLEELFGNLFRNAVEHGSTGSQSSESAGDVRRSDAPASPSGSQRDSDDAVEHGSTSPDSQARQDAVEHASDAAAVRVGSLPDTEGFYVADDGPGIPEGEREQVLELGYTTAEDGTGFGLAIVNEIAEAHGWSVTVTESEDGGARFEITGIEPVDETTGSPSLGGSE